MANGTEPMIVLSSLMIKVKFDNDFELPFDAFLLLLLFFFFILVRHIRPFF